MKPPARRDALTILVVEDDAALRQMYSQFLRTKRCRVYEAMDGRAGIDLAVELRPDAIVLDLAMPRVDGWTVLSHLRGSSWTADIPVVVCTAAPIEEHDVLTLGANVCIMKPCTPESLWRQIQELTDDRQRTI